MNEKGQLQIKSQFTAQIDFSQHHSSQVLSSLPIVALQPDKRHANRTVLRWSGMTGTEHNGSCIRKKMPVLMRH